MSYQIGDMLIRIKNAQAVGKEQVSIPFSIVKLNIANVLKESGYIGKVERKKRKSKKSEHEYLDLTLRYGEDGEGKIENIKMISKPSRRMYINSGGIKKIRSGHGIAVISTPKGVMTSKDARKSNHGGEILFEIW
jgi:small subunit ribosomal protein S8